MADFRRVVTALAVLALLTGFAVTANAQVPAFACTASAAVPPLLRAEGLTELTGDIVLNCSGGNPANTGIANIQIFLGTQVTSRLIDTNQGLSEALLLVDEPNPINTAGVIAPSATGCGATAVGCTSNVFRGSVSGNSVTFIGVPIVPPGTTATRIFRVTNVRANASAVSPGSGGIPGQVQAFVTISGSTSIPLNNPTQVVGFVQNGLTTSLRNSDNDTMSSSGLTRVQCTSVGRTTLQGYLRFTENFATAFKLRVAPATTPQTQPGAVYNTESGLILSSQTTTGVTGVANVLGLADFGTRLRATFANIPSGVNVYVSVGNTNATTGRVAQLVPSETGALASVTPLTTVNVPTTGTAIAQVSLSGGSGVAVWEVTDASSLTADNYDFSFVFQWSANAAGNSPATGVQGTVAQSFAPAPPAFSATSGGTASATLPIPRFVDTGTPRNLLTISVCRTSILFPFVTNQGGFDTGLAIANTSQDPFGTSAQAGTCTLNFYGASAPSAATSPSVAAGTVYTTIASASAPGFQGYVIAVCNFQLAHGFAFISDVGARNLAMGYLGLILPEVPRSVPAGGEALNN